VNAPGDPYKILQVDSEAEDEVIAAAYRRLARKYHPDMGGPGSESRMAEINAAWEVIGDPERRAAFDRERTSGRSSFGGGYDASMRTADGDGAAGPPPGRPSGSVLNFGRYARWSLGEIARVDLEYIEWLDRTPIGRPYREEIDAILRRVGRRTSANSERETRRGLFRRR
jgi:curved DNA-binding protein CbpA